MTNHLEARSPGVHTRRQGRSIRTTSRIAAVSAAAALLAGCGGSDAGTVTPVAPRGPLLSCAGPPFAPAAFDAPADAETASGPEAEALRSVLASPEQGLGLATSGWRRLGVTSDEVAFGRGEPPFLGGYVMLRRVDGAWTRPSSGQSCIVRPYEPGRTSARWGLDPVASPIGADAATIDVIVNDAQCAGGEGPGGRLLDPTIVATEDAITITFATRALEGAQTCPSHPPAHRQVVLPEPLRGRALLDGGVYPARPPCRIEGGDCENERF